jgi:hypothetical protein
MGPTCEVVLAVAPTLDTLIAVDAYLSSVAESIERTRKGRTWNVWVGGRPIHVAASDSPSVIALAAGCNAPQDYALLRQFGSGLAQVLGGTMSELVK